MAFIFSVSNQSFARTASLVQPQNLIEKENFPPRWKKLGIRKVNYRLDRDEIYVTAREGRFQKLLLQVSKGGINLHRVVVHFKNGTSQTLRVNQSIAPGTQSGPLDLQGKKRFISKVVFYYDTKNFSNKKALVTLWGRH